MFIRFFLSGHCRDEKLNCRDPLEVQLTPTPSHSVHSVGFLLALSLHEKQLENFTRDTTIAPFRKLALDSIAARDHSHIVSHFTVIRFNATSYIILLLHADILIRPNGSSFAHLNFDFVRVDQTSHTFS